MTTGNVHTIGNQYLEVQIDPFGAELASIKAVEDNTEFLWQGNPDIWSGRAPILFPIVGALKNGQYRFKEQQFDLPRHGLARKSAFDACDVNADSIALELVSNAETNRVFPWEFLFSVRYALDGNRIHIDYTVVNTGNALMRFTVGSHPAFKLPGPIDTYTVRFSEKEALQRYPLNDEGLIEETGVAYELENTGIRLNKSIFDDDALIFKNIRSNTISLYENAEPLVHVHTGGAPHLGIWAKPAAPFVCIEPWFGYTDSTDASGNWEDKPAMMSIAPEEQFFNQWTIELPSVGR